MLNQRLQTQPLDPAVLQKLGIDPPTGAAPASPAAATQPLAPLPSLAPLPQPALPSDQFRTAPLPRQDGLPAQSNAVSSALNTRLNPQEAELLLNVSANLSSLRQQQPQQFQTVLAGLQNLRPGQGGQVDFSALNAEQSQALSGLGLTPQNTYTIFQQLNQMILPGQTGDSTQAFQKIQASVTGFISNLDLRQQTVSTLQQQARDLTAVQGVVSSLAAGSISALLQDKTAGVYDLGVSRITSENFDLKSGMDYTLARVMLVSQQSPQTLQQMESLIGRVKQEQPLGPQDRQLLQQFGLNMNAHNKLESMVDGQGLDFSAVKQLEDVIYSMKDPSPAYQQVLQASARVIDRSGKVQEIAARIQTQSQVVVGTMAVVEDQTQQVQKLRTDANFLESRVKFSQQKVDNLTAAMASATGLFRQGPVNHTLLAAFNIRVDESNGQRQFFINNQPVAGLTALKHMGELVREHEAEIRQMFAELTEKKTETVKASAQLSAAKDNLVAEVQTLEALGQQAAAAKEELVSAQADFQATVVAVADDLKPDEKEMVSTQITPIVSESYEVGLAAAERAEAQVKAVVAEARQVIVAAEVEIAAVAVDQARWEETLGSVAVSLQNLAQQREELNTLIQKETGAAAPAPPPAPERSETDTRRAAPPAEEAPALLSDSDNPETVALRRRGQDQVQARIQSAFQDRQNQEKKLNEARDQARRMDDFHRGAREQLQAEQQRLRQPD